MKETLADKSEQSENQMKPQERYNRKKKREMGIVFRGVFYVLDPEPTRCFILTAQQHLEQRSSPRTVPSRVVDHRKYLPNERVDV